MTQFLEKYTSHFIWKGCVWEGEQNCNILTPTLLAITAFLSRSPVLLNRGHSLSRRWLSLPHLVSNWYDLQTNFLSSPSYIIVHAHLLLVGVTNCTHSTHPRSRSYSAISRRGHLLFTQVHFLFWQLGRVVGQYTTHGTFLFFMISQWVFLYFSH